VRSSVRALSLRRSAPTVSMRLVKPFRAVGRALGLDSTSAWANEGFSETDFENLDGVVPLAVAERLLAAAVEASGVEDFGLLAAEAVEPGLFDLIEYSARSKPTWRGALSCICRLFPLISDFCDLLIDEHTETTAVTMTLHDSVKPHPSIVEFGFAYLVLSARRLTERADFSPKRVYFRHSAPEDTRHYETLFGAPVNFCSSMDRIMFHSRDGELPIGTADAGLSALLDRVADGLLAERRRRDLSSVERVRSLLTELLPRGEASATKIASSLGVTPRTLHRRLADEGVKFRDLIDDARRRLALAYVEEAELSVSEVAYLLGFSGVPAFHRAFRRWTNETPGARRLRAAERQRPSEEEPAP
jgi:AraC-like DNA-binding protein